MWSLNANICFLSQKNVYHEIFVQIDYCELKYTFNIDKKKTNDHSVDLFVNIGY